MSGLIWKCVIEELQSYAQQDKLKNKKNRKQTINLSLFGLKENKERKSYVINKRKETILIRYGKNNKRVKLEKKGRSNSGRPFRTLPIFRKLFCMIINLEVRQLQNDTLRIVIDARIAVIQAEILWPKKTEPRFEKRTIIINFMKRLLRCWNIVQHRLTSFDSRSYMPFETVHIWHIL